MIRSAVSAMVLTTALAGPAWTQTMEEPGLRGSSAIGPQTLIERRLERQDGPAAQRGRTGGNLDDVAALLDSLEEGEAGPVDLSPGQTDTASALADGDGGADERDPARRSGNDRAPRIPARGIARPAIGPVDSQPRTGAELRRGPREPEDQPRTFAGRPAGDDLFIEEEGLFDPLGLRAGSFVFFPSVTVTGGVTDNRSRSRNGRRGAFYRIRPELAAESDWSRHQLRARAQGNFQGFPGNSDDNTASASAELNGRIDAGLRTTVDLAASYALEREDDSSANLTAADSEGIIAQRFGAAAGVTRGVGLFEVGLRGTVDRELFGESAGGVSADGSGAVVAPSDDRSNTEALARLRVGLDNEGALRPYLEVSAGRREFDGKGDAFGFDRDSTITEMRGGLVLDMAPKLSVDANLGYRRENVNDGRLKDLEGIVFDASAIWSPDRVTLLTVTAGTDFDTTTIAAATGSITYSGAVELRRALRPNLVFDASVGLSYERFAGFHREDLRTDASAGLTLDLNRTAALTAQYSYERLDSTATGVDYSANTIEVGVRLQR